MIIQEEFLGLQKIVFPINRNNLSVLDYLRKNTYPEFLRIIKTINCITNDYNNIEELCYSIIETLSFYNDGMLLKSYSAFYEAIDKIHQKLYFSYIEETNNIHGEWEKYCRVRSCRSDEKYSALEMLHLPFTMREKASTKRFSLPGTPCSYMSLQDCLAWLECDKPENFVLMKIGINSKEKKKYKILRLDIRPHEYFRLDGFNNIPQGQVKLFLTNLCYTLPIVSACSFVCKHKEAAFKEEYIIPQMLISWLKEKESYYIGVRYNTSTDNPEAYTYGGHNIAIPITLPGKNGYCEKLQKIFDIEHAEVNYYNISRHETLPWLIRSYLEHQ